MLSFLSPEIAAAGDISPAAQVGTVPWATVLYILTRRIKNDIIPTGI